MPPIVREKSGMLGTGHNKALAFPGQNTGKPIAIAFDY
jgi:hypothetical protein